LYILYVRDIIQITYSTVILYINGYLPVLQVV
jgi:hypothetical protein